MRYEPLPAVFSPPEVPQRAATVRAQPKTLSRTVMQRYTGEAPINVGSGEDISIRALAEKVAATVGYAGQLEFDPSMPDGTPRKLLDVSRINALGWRARIPLADGIRSTYEWYQASRVGQ